jgi:hypothetical protein
MATVYSGEVSVGSYNRIRIQCNYSGTSANLTVQFRRTSAYTSHWSDSTAKLTFNGTTKNAGYNYSGRVGTDWVNLVTVNGYYIPTSGGTFSWNFSNPAGGVLGCSGSIWIPSQATAPSNPTISNVSTTTTTLTGTLNLSSWGNPSSGRFEYYFGTTSDTTSDYTLSPTSGYSSSKTASINKTGLTSNQHYYVRYRVWNQQLNNPSGLILGGAYITKPAASTNQSVSNITVSSARINWTIPADGGHYAKKYFYSLDNGTTWNLALTYSGGSAGTGNYTINGLTPGTNYTVKFKVNTSAGDTTCPNFTFSTNGGLYGSVNGKTKLIRKLYGSVNGKTKRITKLYGSVNGKTKRIF